MNEKKARNNRKKAQNPADKHEEEQLKQSSPGSQKTFQKDNKLGNNTSAKANSRANPQEDTLGKTAGFIVTIIIHFGLIWAVNNVTNWDHSFLVFIKDDFEKVVWVFTLSLVVGILVNFVSIFVTNKKVRNIMQIIENSFSLLSIRINLVYFPYDFKELVDIHNINSIIKVLLNLGAVALIIAIVITFFKLIATPVGERIDKG
jgi:uncharacterized membrane protein